MPAKVSESKEMVEVFVPGNDMKDKVPIPVTINGYRYLVPVNQRVSVPKAVAEVLEHTIIPWGLCRKLIQYSFLWHSEASFKDTVFGFAGCI